MSSVLRLSLLLLATIALTTCSSKHEAQPVSNPVPSMEALQSKLMSELDRLGIDVDKTTSIAPSGAENEVFDLSMLVLDADGAGGNPPTGIELKWTERLAGDYDQNSEVGMSDLTPLAAYFSTNITYDDPGMHEGFPFWPQGTPTVDPGRTNWRMARIDGDFNGELNLSDITPIATHWVQHIDGYRVYRLRPGDPSFILQPDPGNASAAFTIPRPTVAAGDPVRYTFTDTDMGVNPAGYWEYYVAPYCNNDSQEGPMSRFAGAPVDQGQVGGHHPSIVLTADVMSGSVPLTVTFDLAGSSDPDGTIVAYMWDMDQNPSSYEWDSSPSTQLQMTYNTTGTKDQWAMVRDNDGNIAEARLKISVGAAGGNLPPIAELYSDPPGGTVPLLITWKADWSHDLDGNIVKYEWDMDQTPATFEYDSGTDPTVAITYNTGGTKRQYVRVTDDQGATDTCWADIYVDGPATNQAPSASFFANPSSGAAPLLINFDASGSMDPDGFIANFEWDYEGTGTFTAPSGSDVGSYTYNTAGSYMPAVRVTDDGGATATTSIPIQVYPPGGVNAPPTAAMTHFPITGAASLSVTFDGSTSTDTDGSIVNYGWDFDTDGTIDINSSVGFGAAHTFTAVNNWKTTLTVTDDKGATDSVFVYTNVTGAGGANQPPVAAMTATPTSGANPLTVNFDATTSTDSDGTVIGYAFDYTGNGFFDQSGASATASYTYTVPGNYSVKLVVYDDKGASAGLYQTISVSSGATYWHTITAIPGQFDAQGCSLASVQNFPAIAYTDRSSTIVGYARAKDVNGTGKWGTRVMIRVLNQWISDISLAMINGRPAVAYRNPISAYLTDLSYDRADDAVGTSWNSSYPVSYGASAGMDCKLMLVNGYPAITHTHGNGDLSYNRATDTSGSNWASEITIAMGGGQHSDMVICQGNPAVCHYQQGQKVFYQRSNHKNGATWVPGTNSPLVTVDAAGGQDSSIVISGGVPMVCYFTYWAGNDGLKFSKGNDAYGNTWTTPVVLDSGSTNIGSYCDMATVNGIPYIVYRDMGNTLVKAIFATDATATSWGTPETIANDVCYDISCAEINGHAAVTWCSSQGIEYAIKY